MLQGIIKEYGLVEANESDDEGKEGQPAAEQPPSHQVPDRLL